MWTPVDASAVNFGVLGVYESGGRKPQYRSYAVAELPAVPDGRRFRVVKGGGVSLYHVLISVHQADLDLCECRRFDQVGKCTHVEALRRVYQKGGFTREPPKE